ncbi:MAG: aspartate ammonia-lyase, partial [Anaerolineae bacterium]|nr:aspartate ammonia-lyase [Anaerolineae bacterium]
MTTDFRIEKDSLGPVQVPADALYGAQTMRAVENFPISGIPFPRSFIRALGLVKLAAAQVNQELGHLEPQLAEAIVQAS